MIREENIFDKKVVLVRGSLAIESGFILAGGVRTWPGTDHG